MTAKTLICPSIAGKPIIPLKIIDCQMSETILLPSTIILVPPCELYLSIEPLLL